MECVCSEFGIEIRFLMGPIRQKIYAEPRQEAYRRLYQTGRYTLPQIGRMFGDRHHTTILHGIRKAEERLRGS